MFIDKSRMLMYTLSSIEKEVCSMNSTGSSFPYRYTHTLMTVQKPPYNFLESSLQVAAVVSRFNRETKVGRIVEYRLTSRSFEATYAVQRQLTKPGCAFSRFSRMLLEANVPGIKGKIENSRLLKSVSPPNVAQSNCDETSRSLRM